MATISVADKLAKILRDNEQAKYYTALGAFCDQFSIAEAELYSLLLSISRIPRQTGKAIFAGTRGADAVSNIKRLLETRPLRSKRKHYDLTDALDQYLAILKDRNLIFHYGGKWRPGDIWVVSNADIAHSERSLETRQITPQTLENMRIDLLKVGLHFAVAVKQIPDYLRPVVRRVLEVLMAL